MTTDTGKLLLRFGFSFFLIALHGIPKVQNLLSDEPQFASIFGMGVIISLVIATIFETIFPLLVMIGYKTRWASIPIIITMLVAIFDYHLHDPLSVKEKPFLFLIGFVCIALIGPGKFSVDKK